MAEIEGTYTLDGMLQGTIPAPHADSMTSNLQEWVKSANQSGFPFSLQSDAGQFSLLCGNQRQKITSEGISIDGTLVESINALIESLPQEGREKLFSTVRSSEIVKGATVQGVYMIGPDGFIKAQTRSVETATQPPEAPLEKKDVIKTALIAAGLIGLFLVISSFFLPYKQWFGGAKDRLAILSIEDVEFDTSLYDDFVVIEKEKIDRNRGGLRVRLKRGKRWDEIANPELEIRDNKIDWDQLLVLSNLKKGSIPCKVYTTEKGVIFETKMTLASLQTEEESVVLIALPAKGRVQKLKLSR